MAVAMPGELKSQAAMHIASACSSVNLLFAKSCDMQQVFNLFSNQVGSTALDCWLCRLVQALTSLSRASARAGRTLLA